jgi:sugar lactone lactonase YvrE
MAFDASGNMYMVDGGNNLIRKVTPAGVVTTYAGSGTIGYQDGNAQTAEFAAPTGLAIDGAGDIFVADYGSNCIREITPDGNVTTIAGNPFSGTADGIGTAASFDGPANLVFDASGNLFVTDYGNNLIRKITFK